MADEPDKRPKRRVKNPETFRERALKATQATEAPKRRARARGFVRSLLRPVFGPIRRSLVKLFKVQPFKTIAKIGHWVGLLIWPRYIRNSWKELRLVTWPNWRQSRQLTFAVLAFAVVFGGAVAAVDYGLDKVFRHILLR